MEEEHVQTAGNVVAIPSMGDRVVPLPEIIAVVSMDVLDNVVVSFVVILPRGFSVA